MFESMIRAANNVLKLNGDEIMNQVFQGSQVKGEIKKLNVDQMYEQGIDSNGASLGQYTARTIKIKTEKNQRTDHITLRDTKEFHDSIRVGAESNAVIITGDMVKPDQDLEVRFPFALGLTDSNWDRIRGLIIPDVRKIVWDKIRA